MPPMLPRPAANHLGAAVVSEYDTGATMYSIG